MKRWTSPATLLSILLFGGFLAGGLRHPLSWTAVAGVLWLTAITSPAPWAQAPDLKLWALWLCWMGLSTLASDQPLKNLFPLSRWLGVIVFFAMAGFHWKEEDRRRWLAGLCLFGAILGLAALFVKIPGYPMVGLMWPYYNYTAFVLAAVFAAGLGALGHPSREIKGGARWALLALMAFALAVILAAHSRSGLWAAAAASVVWMIRRGKSRLLPAAVLALLAAAALLPLQPAIHLFKLDTVGGFKRPQIWKTALQVAGDHPVLGEGPGNFEQGFMRHNFVSGFAARYGMGSDHAHSEPLEMAAETGWVGLFLFLAALLVGLKRLPLKPTMAQEAGLCALTAMSAQCLIDNMLHMPALALLFFSALACAQDAPEPEQQRESSGTWRLACLIGLILSLTAWIPRRLVQSCQEKYRGESDPIKRLELAGRCARLFPYDYYHHEMLAESWLGVRPPHFEQALAEFQRASRLNPTNAIYPRMQGEILRLGQRWEDVAALAGEAVALEPDYQGARLLRAEAWARMGHPDWAEKELVEIRDQRDRRAATVVYTNYDTHIFAFDKERYELVDRLVRQPTKKKVK